MRHIRAALLVAAIMIVPTTVACGGTSDTAAPEAPAVAKDCPSSPMPANPAGGNGPAAAVATPTIVVPVDTSTSTVLRPGTAAQIQCGRTPVTTHSDLTYATVPLVDGQGKQLAMDIQVPQTAGPKPLVVYVPGGGFVMADKGGNLALRTFVAEAGYVVASIQYRVQPDGATYADSISDVKAAIRYLRAHAAEYDINPGSVGVWGDSAGGYLAAMTGVSNGDKRYDIGADLDQSSDVQAVIDKFGAADLSRVQADFDPDTQRAMAPLLASTARYVNGPTSTASLADDPAAVARANPITYIKPNDPPFVIFHGSVDTTISPSQTLELHNALRAAGVDSTRYVVEGAAHGDVAFTGSPQNSLQWTTQDVAGRLVDFLNQHLER
ncbi:alpha/beta hydrolase [Nocardia sp. NBC_00565]|uniref:alpha/beta hydrolase n=1 Tax=Nocardia sp. NBC_00565 TaxID=2975993 RepID=UPI002E8079BA|nr:alpha/beta hydrolase [Nocardia sp. NBC_00565]WUC03218.1 alpha/beta hydrolase [Nocardia sp. NBC_00565]